MFRLYDGVETFVLFIGYPRSSHSLVGAILDAHPEIIIPHEYNLLGQWDQFRTAIQKQRNLEKYFLFYELHQLSTRQATFGLRAKTPLFTVDSPYKYNVPGLWQGGYCNRIRVWLICNKAFFFFKNGACWRDDTTKTDGRQRSIRPF